MKLLWCMAGTGQQHESGRLGYCPGRDAAALPREKGLLGSHGMSPPSCFSLGDVPGHQWDAGL